MRPWTSMRPVQLLFAAALATACNPLVSFGEEYCFEESCQGDVGPGGSGTGGTNAGGTGGTGSGVSYRELVLADSPKVYFRFGEPTMSTTLESEVGAYAGTTAFENASEVQFAATGALEGDADTAVSLTDYGRMNLDAPVDFPGLAPHTIEFFLKTTVASGRYLHPVANQNNDLGWFLKVDQTTLTYFRRSSTANESRFTDWTTTGTWQHVVIVFDGEGVTFYERGQPTGAAQPMPITIDQYQATLRVRDTGPPSPTETDAAFDELAIYDHALTWQQICNHYRCAQSRDNCSNPTNMCDGG